MHFVKLRWLNSFSRQLMAAGAGGILFLAGLAVAGLVALFFFQGNMFSEIGISEYAESIGEQIRFDAEGRPAGVDLEPMTWLYDSLAREVTYRVLDENGNVLLSSEPGQGPLAVPGEKVDLTDRNFVFERAGIPMHAATEEVDREGRTYLVQFAMSQRLSDMLRHYIGEPLFSRTFLIFCLAALLVYFLVMSSTLRVILKPLNEASAIAARMTPRNLGARLEVDGVPSELRPLVENFNSALDRLEHNYRLQQEFLAAAAHELKTPLALIRGQIELGIDATNRQGLLQDVSRMGRQVQQLLHLAEASEPQNYVFAALDLESLVQEVARYIERLAGAQGVQLQVEVERGAALPRADRGALFTLLKNLLENAIQHSSPGAVVRLRASSQTIVVEDEGEGASPEDLPKLFARFWRSPQRRDLGAGLGLSICREIAAMHGWQLEGRNGECGMVFELRLEPPV
jgi:two-component system, OmpR family, sensor histidine kinase QseC